jgi:hypothetical protein
VREFRRPASEDTGGASLSHGIKISEVDMVLVGKDGKYEKPKYPCIVPGCEKLAFQESPPGACKDHMWEKIEWLKRRVMSHPSPYGPRSDVPAQPGSDARG